MKEAQFSVSSSASNLAAPVWAHEIWWRLELWDGVRAFACFEDSGETEAQWKTPRSGKATALLAFLAIERRAISRERLVETFWPDATPEKGANSFRVALHALREFLEPIPELRGQILLTSRGMVSLGSGLQTDISDFAALREKGLRDRDSRALEKALALVRGPFLRGFYEDWATPYISRFEEQALEIAEILRREKEAFGDVLGALDVARHALQIAPLREDTIREIVKLGLLCGQSSVVRREFEAWRKSVRRAQGTTPPSFAEVARAFKPASIRATSPIFPKMPRALPIARTAFWGRETERAQIRAKWEARPQLLTLCGPSGIGKTRFALECAREFQNAGTSVVWLPLAHLLAPGSVAGALAEALGGGEKAPQIRAALAFLARKSASGRVLLVWDNCEHLGGEVARQIETLLEDAPFASHLATSTLPLGLSFEEVVALGPLREAGRALFLERAQKAHGAEAHGAIADDEESLNWVDAVCEALGGVPLAIEIAAARTPIFSPQQIFEALVEPSHGESESALDWLHPHRDVPARHRTLREAIEWSARQLPPSAARFWSRCAVFPAPFSLEAARAVTGMDDGPIQVLTLRDCSLLGLDTNSESPRAFWIPSLREFALATLSNEQKREAQRRSAAYFLSLAQKWGPLLDGDQGKRAKVVLEDGRAHFHAAFEFFWSETQGGLENALQLCAALSWFWEQKGPSLEHRSILQTTLEMVAPELTSLRERWARGETPELRESLRLRAQVFEAAGKLGTLGGEIAAGKRHLETALELFTLLKDQNGTATCLYGLGFNALQSGDLEGARALCNQSVEMGRAIGEGATLGDALYNLSLVAVFAGDYGVVRELSQERLALHRALGDARGMAVSLENLGLAALFENQLDAALAYYESAQKGFSNLDDNASLARCFWGAGRALMAQENLEAARAKFENALRLTLETHNSWALPFVWESLAYYWLARGENSRAAQILGAAASLREIQREPLPSPALQMEFDGACAALTVSLGDAAFAAYFQTGQNLSRDEVGALAVLGAG